MDSFINKIFRAAGLLGINNKRVIELLQAGDEKSDNILKSYLGAAGFGALRSKEMITEAKREIEGLPPIKVDKPHGTKAPNAMGYNPNSMTSKTLLKQPDEPVEPPTEPHSYVPNIEKAIDEVLDKYTTKVEAPEEVWKAPSELKEPDHVAFPQEWYKHSLELVDELGSIKKMCDHLKISRTTFYNRKREALKD